MPLFRRLASLWNNPEREGRRLARDARYVLDDIVAHYPAERAGEVARTAMETLAEARPAIGAAPARRRDVIGAVESRHRAARRTNDQARLSGLTLSLICLHADALGRPGEAAVRAVDGFLARWRHVGEGGR